MVARLKGLGTRERVLIGILGGFVVFGVLYLLVFAGGGGSDDGTDGGTVIRPSPRSPTATATATTSPGAQPTPIETFDSGDARDPFRSPIAGRVPPPGGGTPGPSDPGSGGSGDPSPGPTGGTSTGTRVELLDIFERDGTRFASVDVGGEIHHVKEGDTFSDNYRAVSITEECATFVKGDERFTLCIGQEVFK